MHLNAVGAYGRTADIADWVAGKDFYSLTHHRYFSIRDAKYIRLEGFSGIYFWNMREPDGPIFFVSLLIETAKENQ